MKSNPNEKKNEHFKEENDLEIKLGLGDGKQQNYADIKVGIADRAISSDKLDEVTVLHLRDLDIDPSSINKIGNLVFVRDGLKVCIVDSTGRTLLVGTDNIPVFVPVMQKPFNFMQSNVAATQTNVALDVLGLAGNTAYLMPFSGSVIGISVASNAARTGGTLTVEAMIDTDGTGLTAVLDATNTQYHYNTQDALAGRFTRNQRIGARITTTGTWTPTTADIVVTVITT